MIDFSFTEKLVQLKDILLSSPFFFISLIVGIILLIIMIIGINHRKRINRIIFIISWIFVIGFCIFRYFNFFVSIFDRLFGRIVQEIYFPSISVYTVMLIFTNILFTYSLLNKKLANIYKIINITMSMTLDFLFIIILDTIMKKNIDIYADLVAYTNPELLVLLEVSMIIFATWMSIIIMIFLVKKYAVKKVFINNYKEQDYEIVDLNNNINKKDDTEILDLDDKANNESIEILNL